MQSTNRDPAAVGNPLTAQAEIAFPALPSGIPVQLRQPDTVACGIAAGAIGIAPVFEGGGTSIATWWRPRPVSSQTPKGKPPRVTGRRSENWARGAELTGLQHTVEAFHERLHEEFLVHPFGCRPTRRPGMPSLCGFLPSSGTSWAESSSVSPSHPSHSENTRSRGPSEAPASRAGSSTDISTCPCRSPLADEGRETEGAASSIATPAGI